MAQILRVVPYSATQLYSYEVLKKRFQNEKGELSLSARLAAGGLAGMTATLVISHTSQHSAQVILFRMAQSETVSDTTSPTDPVHVLAAMLCTFGCLHF